MRVPHAGSYRNVFTGDALQIVEAICSSPRLFADFPVALLVRESAARCMNDAAT